MGEILGRRLNELADDHLSIGDVRGKGLFWGVELVKNRDTKEPFVTRDMKFESNMLKKVSSEAMRRGAYVVNVINTLIIAPPLIVTENEIDEGISILDESLNVADRETH